MPEKWEKVLYKKQHYPDNFVDATFLSDMRKNVNLYRYSWWEAFVGVCFVTQEVCCTVLFVIVFILMEENSVITMLGSFLIISYFMAIQMTASYQWTWVYFCDYSKSSVIFFTFGYLFSPALKTLTQTISTDTIYAMVVLMLIVHVLFQDYGTDAAIVSGTLSVNSALFAAVCLASRLPTVMHTFVLLVNAVILFVLLPLMRKQLKNNNRGLLITTAMVFICVSATLIHISLLFTILFAILCLFINIIFPSLFIYCQKYKENIFGPWDEAFVEY